MELNRQDKTAYQAASYFDTIRLQDENGEPVMLPQGAKIIFGVKDDCFSNDYLIKKILTAEDEIEGAYPVYLTPEDTDELPDIYYYDVSVQTAQGDLIKIVPKSVFIIADSVTRKENDE